MGSGNLFKAMIGSKRGKEGRLKKEKRSSATVRSKDVKKSGQTVSVSNNFTVRDTETRGIPIEDLAATRIQTAFRAYKARKALRHLKGIARAKLLAEKHYVKKQAAVTLRYLHSWSQIQSQVKARRICMVTEDRLKQKNIENQQKLEAKLHDVEVEWNGGTDTKEEILGRIHQREEAAVKRERALAYAFTHQWRVDGRTQWLGNYELGNTSWGWSWKERWIGSRPWETRHPSPSITPKKPQSGKPACKNDKNGKSPSMKSLSVSDKASVPNGKTAAKGRRLSFPGAEKPATREVQAVS
ncbi:PREDICTED: protein IQ-DOMAIN 1 [Tarenaya hassleriana]|uniref:protein IQ-DOMAIN 1 n=1 Tax=Tarenaya hassleriana TaxID=28532 RepID=UPI00053C535D|nr:PREDICTED: protein IQ-DOMAIN 1 [Tarenaya hassleriana]XP_010549378.1 PREDICTED: protein IQ-DOMAIN 1 [Tarenaya hassleriana]XP_010549379.1 PREDICTED: protein IQ-DOMAIN 1 [Tarenaya hassleriana]XP_019058867.1 PREDICTED: protein IQ-DOMAIN 1 [Tarenaya hassleriana]XP_019058868.1 PREDICTED: protein IQ-DOMAIN 1 [Tarenaya hassleriana]